MQLAEPNLALYQIETRLAELLELRNIAAEDGDTEALAVIDKQFEEYFLREVKKVDGICHALHAFEQAAAFGVMKLSEIGRLEVEQWLAAKPDLSWWTKDGLRRLLGRIFAAAIEWKWFEGEKPTLGIRLGRMKLVYEKKLLTIEQFRLLLSALDEEMRFLVLILFGLGLRISEALSLKWSDLDWEKHTIALGRRWHRGDMSEFMKTEGSAATMRLSPSLLAEFARRRGKPWDLLFPGENGNPYDDRDLGRERLRPVLKRLGIYTRGNLWHQFRRMYNTYLQQAGATPLEAQKAMRHASLDMTYLYTLTDAEREVSQQQAMFDKLMEGGTKQ